METNEKRSSRGKMFGGIIVLLLVILGVASYSIYNENHTNNELTAQQNDLQNRFRKLSDTVEMKSTEVAQLTGKNAELDKTIIGDEAVIAKEKKDIGILLHKNKMTKAELAKANDLISEYVASIADLKNTVAQLTEQNQQLTAQNQQLSTDLTSEKQNSAQLSQTNMGLSKQVEIGSLLTIPKVEVEAVKTKGNGKEVAVRKAKSAQSLRITFETGRNKVLNPGPLSLYVRVINPKGETIEVQDQGSGTIKTVADSGSMVEVPYTKKADIDWTQDNKKVVVYWGSDINTPGTYKVELYQTGHLIAQGDTKLN